MPNYPVLPKSVSTLSDLFDTEITAPVNGNVLAYNNASGKWENSGSAGGGVTDHTLLTNIGTNTHDNIDTHIAQFGPGFKGSPAVASAHPWQANINGIFYNDGGQAGTKIGIGKATPQSLLDLGTGTSGYGISWYSQSTASLENIWGSLGNTITGGRLTLARGMKGSTLDNTNAPSGFVSSYGIGSIARSAIELGGDVINFYTEPANPVNYDSVINPALAMTIISENVGIGIDAFTAPFGKLHVESGSSGVVSISGKPLVVESGGGDGISMLVPSGGSSLIEFINSSDITGSGNIRYVHGTNEIMDFTVAKSVAMTIDKDQNIGIGETVPLGKLHVKKSDSAVGQASLAANALVLEDIASNGMSILNPANKIGYIVFGNASNKQSGQFYYKHSTLAFTWITGDLSTTESTKMILDDGLLMGNGGTITPSGGDKGVGTINATELFVNGTSIGTQEIVSKVADYTLVLTDANKMIDMNLAVANTLTIPIDATVAFPIGTRIIISQEGAGQTTIAGAGVTLQSAGANVSIASQYGSVTIIKKAVDTWRLIGDLA